MERFHPDKIDHIPIVHDLLFKLQCRKAIFPVFLFLTFHVNALSIEAKSIFI